ncbi:uncharacterized protein VTP21DRAFT_6803 [Calcarisporiella thermophila]|uniref:uncharacterized protein n=1 Tax=Calcarisporiella thermophila TaxID=911321 RepID=UPI003743B410
MWNIYLNAHIYYSLSAFFFPIYTRYKFLLFFAISSMFLYSFPSTMINDNILRCNLYIERLKFPYLYIVYYMLSVIKCLSK